MLKDACSVFSFLSIIPAGDTTLNTVAKYMYLFPLVGIALGLVAGSIGFGLYEIGLEPLLIGLFVVAFLAIVTGIHHTDGLADWADGLAKKGAMQEKLAAMKDVSVGSAGVTALVLYFVAMVATLSFVEGLGILYCVLFSEIIAKFSMVLMASTSRPAAAGSATPFVAIMQDKKRLAIAATISIVPLVLLGGPVGLVMFAAGIAVTLFLVGLSTRSFGGITGDVLGATNELSRLAAMLVFVVL